MGASKLIVNVTQGTPVCESCALADTPFARLRGLLGRTGLASGEGLLLRPAPAVHTWFMRFDIDVVFLDRELRVVRVVRGLRPWRMAAQRGSKATLELPAGECERRGLHLGDRLSVVDRLGRRSRGRRSRRHEDVR